MPQLIDKVDVNFRLIFFDLLGYVKTWYEYLVNTECSADPVHLYFTHASSSPLHSRLKTYLFHLWVLNPPAELMSWALWCLFRFFCLLFSFVQLYLFINFYSSAFNRMLILLANCAVSYHFYVTHHFHYFTTALHLLNIVSYTHWIFKKSFAFSRSSLCVSVCTFKPEQEVSSSASTSTAASVLPPPAAGGYNIQQVLFYKHFNDFSTLVCVLHM